MRNRTIALLAGAVISLAVQACGTSGPSTESFEFTDGPDDPLLETHAKFREFGYDLTPGDVHYYANEVCRSLDDGDSTIETIVSAMNRMPRYNNTDHQLMHEIAIADNCPQHEGKVDQGL